MSNPIRFSDLYNGIVFQGKQVVLPEELEPAEGENGYPAGGQRNKKIQEIHRYRDIDNAMEKGSITGIIGM